MNKCNNCGNTEEDIIGSFFDYGACSKLCRDVLNQLYDSWRTRTGEPSFSGGMEENDESF